MRQVLRKCERSAFFTSPEENLRISSRKNAFFTGEIAIYLVASALSEIESRRAIIHRRVN